MFENLKNQIVYSVIESYKKQDISILIKFIKRFADVKKQSERTYVLQPKYNTINTIGITLSDPITMAVCTCFCVAGEYWPKVLGSVLHEVNKEWLKYRKQQKNK